MSLLPVPGTRLSILWQNTVIDIEPTSRYATDTDTASINTTLALDVPEREQVSFIAPGHYEAEASARELGTGRSAEAELITATDPGFASCMDMLTGLKAGDASATPLHKVKRFHRFTLELDAGNRIIRYFSRLPIIEEPDGSYRFAIIVPVEFVELAKGGDFSVVALLPRSTYDLPDGPLYELELRSYFKGANARVFRDRDGLARRTAVAWYWQQDPELDISYLYRW